MIWKNKKGFTLIELLLVISLISVVIASAFNMFKFGNVAQTLAITEYDIQSQMRVAAQEVNTAVRYATALFALPDIKNLQVPQSINGWNYITTTNIGSDGYGDEIVEYIFDGSDSNPSWKERVIVEAKRNIRYKLEFQKYNSYDEDRLIEFYISVKDTKTGVERNITSEVEAFNSLQIVDRGKPINKKCKALCYKTDPRPLKANAAVSMVLDKSGSMAWNLDGGDASGEKPARMTILKEKASNIIDLFSENPNIYVNIVPFSTSANNPENYNKNREGKSYTPNTYDKFLNAKKESSNIKYDIKRMEAQGGTNTGDGIRRSYYNLVKNYQSNPEQGTDIVNYMIILVDGVSTFYSVEVPGYSGIIKENDYLTKDGEIFSKRVSEYGQVGGNGGKLDTDAEGYVKKIGGMVKGANNIKGVKVYVIGFSNKSADHKSLQNIGEATGAVKEEDGNRFFKATSEEALESIFNQIGRDVVRDLWHVYGPR